MPDLMKHSLRSIFSSRILARAWAPLTRGRASIFTLHRFAVPDLGVVGRDPAMLRLVLARLRREGYRLVGLAEALQLLREPGGRSERVVAFTVDDGYADFALAGADAFLAYDCPVTVFVVTGFVDGGLWLWWDQIEHVCLTTAKLQIRVAVGSGVTSLDLRAPGHRRAEVQRLVERLKGVSEGEKRAAIARLVAAADVELPARGPPRYRGLTWDEVRALESRGVRFGPHTVSHPLLTRTSAEQSEREIVESWRVLRANAREPLGVFAYPNGAFGSREIATVEQAGLDAAVTTVPRYASRLDGVRSSQVRYRLPRFPYPGDPDGVCLVASGFRRISDSVRGVWKRTVNEARVEEAV